MDIHEWVIVHGFLKVDSVKNLDPIVVLKESIGALTHYSPFRKRFVNTENDNSL